MSHRDTANTLLWPTCHASQCWTDTSAETDPGDISRDGCCCLMCCSSLSPAGYPHAACHCSLSSSGRSLPLSSVTCLSHEDVSSLSFLVFFWIIFHSIAMNKFSNLLECETRALSSPKWWINSVKLTTSVLSYIIIFCWEVLRHYTVICVILSYNEPQRNEKRRGWTNVLDSFHKIFCPTDINF